LNRPALLDFLALELPLLLSTVDPAAPDAELEARLLAALEPPAHGGVPHRLWPGLDRSGAAAAALAEDRLKLEGFFARQRHLAELSNDQRLLMLERMVLTRALDQRLKLEFDQKRITWNGYASPQKGFRSTGQEAIVGAALPLRRPPTHPPGPDYDGDVIAPLIRDLGALLMFMPDPIHALRVQFGKTGTPVGGRDLHLGDFEHGVLPPAAPLTIATQTVVGLALASAQRGEDRVFCSFVGDGASSLGEWHESINFAAARRLPMIFCIENNHWALGTHVSEQTATRRFAARGIGYGIVGASVFGNDPEQIAAAFAWAAERARRGAGPTLLEVVTYRRPGHAHHDDDRFHGSPDGSIPGYEYEDERRAWEALDPLESYRARLIEAGLLDGPGFEAMEAAATLQVEEAARIADESPWPSPEEYRSKVFAPGGTPPLAPSQPQTRVLAYDEAVRQALIEAMEDDPEVFVLG
jgi:TPP-dependent pyruvate/acetoin dehydrogenase alpha subunit